MGTVAILGGGHGGFAAAADLWRHGHRVILWSKQPQTLKQIRARGGIGYAGVLGEGLAQVQVADDLASAVHDADLIMICAPTTVHHLFAEALGRVVPDGAAIFLNPGHTCGGLQFLHCLRRAGFSGDVLLGESSILTYACRKTSETDVAIYHLMTNVLVAALPSRRLGEFVSAVTPYYPDILPCATSLEVSVANLNAVIHPAGMVLSAMWIEHTAGEFFFYGDGATPSLGRVMDAVDRERLALARAWGLSEQPDFATLFERLGLVRQEARRGRSCRDTLLASAAIKAVRAPSSLDHRYVHEDVGFGLVPWSELARVVGLELPVTRAIIELSSACNSVDYAKTGLTLAALGLEGCSRDDIWRRLTTG